MPTMLQAADAQASGSDYLMADGYAKFIKLQYVSVGLHPVGTNNLTNSCPSYTVTDVSGRA